MKLGFTELQVFGADKPVLCRDDRRMYLWVPLDKNAAIPPGANALRVAPPEGGGSALSTPNVEKEKRPMPAPPPNGRAPDGARTPEPQPEHWGIDEVVAETEALRGVLQDASARAARLLAALENQRRQGRAVRAAMASLQQLKLDP